MNNPQDPHNIAEQMADAGVFLLRSVQRFNWLLLILIAGGSWYSFDWPFAQSVLIGGLLASISFYMLRRDIGHFMSNFSDAGMNWQAVKKFEKVKFFLKFYGRLAMLAVIMYLLISYISIDVIGLVVGLSTIMISVIIVVLSKGSMLYSAQRYKGA